MFNKPKPFDDKLIWDEIRTIRFELEQLSREMRNQVLDYENLYEKVRSNLAKLSKRARDADIAPESEPDVLSKAREALIARKLSRG